MTVKGLESVVKSSSLVVHHLSFEPPILFSSSFFFTKRVVVVVVVAAAFSSLARMLGECSTIHSLTRVNFFFLIKKKKKVEISSRTLIPLFVPGSVDSGSASCDDCGSMFPNKLRVSSFPDRFPH